MIMRPITIAQNPKKTVEAAKSTFFTLLDSVKSS